MVDFVKSIVHNQDLIDYFQNHPSLVWLDDNDRLKKEGEDLIVTKTTKTYNGIQFHFHSSSMEIVFKPHYFRNGNLHNADDFTARDSITIFRLFETVFDVALDYFKVVNIEFGTNVISVGEVKKLITSLAYNGKNVYAIDSGLAYSKKSFKPDNKGRANKYKFDKAYAKGIQFPQYTDPNMFRYEVKSKQSKYIAKLGIQTFADLVNPTVYYMMADEIIRNWDAVLLCDIDIDLSLYTAKEQKLLVHYSNPLNWYTYTQSNNRNSFATHKRRYEAMLDKAGTNKKKQMTQRIADKLQMLLTGTISTSDYIPEKVALSTVYIDGKCNLSKGCY